MSRRYQKESLDTVSIRKALEFSKTHGARTAPNTLSGNTLSGVAGVNKCSKDRSVVLLLSQLPYSVRTCKNDEIIYQCVEQVSKRYIDKLIFNSRLPLPLLVHLLVQQYIPTYAPYSSRLLDTRAKYDRYMPVWEEVKTGIDITKDP